MKACAVGLLGLSGGMRLAAAVTERAPDAASQVRRRLRFSATFSNPLARPLGGQKFWLYLPAKEGATQSLRDVQVTTPFREYSDTTGNAYLGLSFDDFPPLAQKTVGISMEVLMSAAPHTATVPGQEWLRAERFIESDSPSVLALAEKLRRASDRETARSIFDWVATNLAYAGYLADDYGAAYALEHRRGDCTEYAYLAAALARANGLPARVVGGYVLNQDAAPRADEYHNWAEVYFDGAWRLLDAQKGNWLSPAGQYVAFRYYRAISGNPLGTAHRFHMDGELAVRI